MVAEFGAGLAAPAAEPRVVYQLRYAGQAFELPVPRPSIPTPRSHRGLRRPTRSATATATPKARSSSSTSSWPWSCRAGAAPGRRGCGRPERSFRRVHFDGDWFETPVLRGEPAAGHEAEGPVVFELPEATFVVPPGWSARRGRARHRARSCERKGTG